MKSCFFIEESGRVVGLNVEGDIAIGAFEGRLQQLFADTFSTNAAVGGDVNEDEFGNVALHAGSVDDGSANEAVFVAYGNGKAARAVTALKRIVKASLDVFLRVSVLIEVIVEEVDEVVGFFVCWGMGRRKYLWFSHCLQGTAFYLPSQSGDG